MTDQSTHRDAVDSGGMGAAAAPMAGDAPDPAPQAARPGEFLKRILVGSRQRWRDLVILGSDLAFETDRRGHFVLLAPDEVLGWPAERLMGRPAAILLAKPVLDGGFNPFRPGVTSRGRRAWLRRFDGSLACLSFSTAPVHGPRGRLLGSHGVAVDITEQNEGDAQRAASLLRAEVIDHILSRMRQEVLAPRMMAAALQALAAALGAEGAGVADRGDEGEPVLRHVVGAAPNVAEWGRFLRTGAAPMSPTTIGGQVRGVAPDGRLLLICGFETRFGRRSFLLLWREPGGRPWEQEDVTLVTSAASIIRVILEHDSIQQEMARQARTDPLTGLLNRRAFFEELERRIDRLDRDRVPGTLMFVDLDYFKRVNDTLGHDTGDKLLCTIANLLRGTVRPFDLVARFGGDEFALWLDGMEELGASERAELLRVEAPSVTADVSGMTRGKSEPLPPLTLSIGIATRWPGRRESIEALVQRADQVMYDVKRSGRGHWRVSHVEAW